MRAFLGLAIIDDLRTCCLQVLQPIKSQKPGNPAVSRVPNILSTEEAPALAHPNDSAPFIVNTDASNQGLGTILAQVQESKEHVKPMPAEAYTHPIIFGSRGCGFELYQGRAFLKLQYSI